MPLSRETLEKRGVKTGAKELLALRVPRFRERNFDRGGFHLVAVGGFCPYRIMRNFCGVLLWLLVTTVCPAAEIVAWKVPLSHYLPDGLESEGVVRCKAAPEPSPFFKEADELWDLKRAPTPEGTREIITTQWIVWNATSERLVLKTEWHGIWRLKKLLLENWVPKHYRLTFDLFRVPEDGSALSEKSTRVASHSLVTKAGQGFDLGRSTGGVDFHSKGTTASSDDRHLLIGMELDLSCALPDEPEFAVKTIFSLSPGRSLWVARDFDGKKGLDLKITARIELGDGTPWEELMLVQKGGDVLKVVPDWRVMEVKRVGDSGWLANLWVDPIVFFDLQADGDKLKDPFAEKLPVAEEKLPTFLPFPMVKVPDVFSSLLNQPIMDLRKWDDVSFLDGEEITYRIGYEPLKERAYFYTNDAMKMGMFRAFFQSSCRRAADVVAAIEGDGQTRLIGRSGQRLYLTRTNGDKKVIRTLELEPTVGENDELIDLRLNYTDESIPQHATRLNTCVTLNTGKPLELISGALGEEGPRPLRMKADVQRDLGD